MAWEHWTICPQVSIVDRVVAGKLLFYQYSTGDHMRQNDRSTDDRRRHLTPHEVDKLLAAIAIQPQRGARPLPAAADVPPRSVNKFFQCFMK